MGGERSDRSTARVGPPSCSRFRISFTIMEVGIVQVHIHVSATRHGLPEREVEALWRSGIEDTWLDGRDPVRLLRIAIDQAGAVWELIALVFDGGDRHLVIHAMRLRKVTVTLLERRDRGGRRDLRDH